MITITPLTKESIYSTIRHTNDFKPVLYFKIGQLKTAKKELINYFMHPLSVLNQLGVCPTDEQINKIKDIAELKAINYINASTGLDDSQRPIILEGHFFNFLPTWDNKKLSFNH